MPDAEMFDLLEVMSGAPSHEATSFLYLTKRQMSGRIRNITEIEGEDY
jgi:hypothetical protein